MDWEFKNFLSVWFLRKFGQGFALFLIFKCLVGDVSKIWKNVGFFWEIWLFPNFCTMHSAAGLAKFCTMHSAAGLAKFLYNAQCCWLSQILLSLMYSLGTPGAVGFCLGTPGAVGFFWKFSKSFKSRKIWPGVCPILEILSFCLRLLKISEFRKYSKCRFLGKIGQGSALHWCFRFLKFSKCGFLRKFDQGSALFPKFWGFVRDFWKFLKFLKFLSVKF